MNDPVYIIMVSVSILSVTLISLHLWGKFRKEEQTAYKNQAGKHIAGTYYWCSKCGSQVVTNISLCHDCKKKKGNGDF